MAEDTYYTLDVRVPVRYKNPIGGAYKTGASKNLQYPLDDTTENFYTVFRIKERVVDLSNQSSLARGLKVQATERTDAEIVLPLPPNLSTAYGADYTNTEFGFGGQAFASILGTADSKGLEAAGKEVYDLTVGKVVDAFQAAETTGGGVAKSLGVVGGVIEDFAKRSALDFGPVSAGVGKANNPYQAIVYNNPEFRQHSFSYSLLARNKKESDQISEIIREFKKAMHPEFADGGLVFKYPRVFEIEYVAGVRNNENIFRVGICALRSFSVDYHGEGTPSYFDITNPAPTNVKINMSFQELNILTREDFEGGGFVY